MEDLPVVRLAWVMRRGFFFKSTDFIRLDIGKILKSSYLVKNMGKKMTQSLSKIYKDKTEQRKSNKGKASVYTNVLSCFPDFDQRRDHISVHFLSHLVCI